MRSEATNMISRAMLVNKLTEFARLMGSDVGTKSNCYNLEYQAGYTVIWYDKDGHETKPFGNRSRKATEMWHTLDFAISCVEKFVRDYAKNHTKPGGNGK